MSVALSPIVRPRAWPQFHIPLRTGIVVAEVGAAVAVIAGALGFGVTSLDVQPVPADHTIVTPPPHRQTGPGTGPIPALQLPTH
jgi:hypothetical protein